MLETRLIRNERKNEKKRTERREENKIKEMDGNKSNETRMP
jgi:hypothetical protein